MPQVSFLQKEKNLTCGALTLCVGSVSSEFICVLEENRCTYMCRPSNEGRQGLAGLLNQSNTLPV